jgi:hypothetical protein
MQLIIDMAESDPPAGTVSIGPPTPAGFGQPTPFVGWLGLLRVLGDLLGKPGSSPD